MTKGEKRKLVGQNNTAENKLIVDKAKKAPLKAELISKLQALEKEHDAMKIENEALKLENASKLQIIDNYKKKVADLETKLETGGHKNTEEELDLSFGPRYCSKCDFEAEDGYQLDGHFWSEHDDSDINSFHALIVIKHFQY